MSEEKQTSIRKNLLKLSFVFPDRKLAIEGIDIYCEMLEDLPDEAIIEAIRACLCECRFFPSIADIRERAKPFLEKARLHESSKHEKQLLIDKQDEAEKTKLKNAEYHKMRVEYLEDRKVKGTATRQEIELLDKIKFGQGDLK